MNTATNVVPFESRRPRVERVPFLVSRDRRCGPQARRRRATLFVTVLLALSAALMLFDRWELQRTTPRPPAALHAS